MCAVPHCKKRMYFWLIWGESLHLTLWPDHLWKCGSGSVLYLLFWFGLLCACRKGVLLCHYLLFREIVMCGGKVCYSFGLVCTYWQRGFVLHAVHYPAVVQLCRLNNICCCWIACTFLAFCHHCVAICVIYWCIFHFTTCPRSIHLTLCLPCYLTNIHHLQRLFTWGVQPASARFYAEMCFAHWFHLSRALFGQCRSCWIMCTGEPYLFHFQWSLQSSMPEASLMPVHMQATTFV